MEVATGALLSTLLEKLFESMASLDLLSFARKSHVLAEEVRSWGHRLKAIQWVLEDAEEQQMTNKIVKVWLNDLRDLAYDIEDILDEFAYTVALRNKFGVGESDQASTSKIQKLLIPSCCAQLKSSTIKFNDAMLSKIRGISNKLQIIMAQKEVLKLRKIVGGSTNKVMYRRHKLPTTSLVDEANIYGREEDRKALLQLMNKAGNEDNEGTPVIAIVGLGGVGKTTLAQLIFNDASQEFDFKSWVSVGEDFDISKMTKTILQNEGDQCNDLNTLQLQLKEKLSRKKFLVVLDDVWTEDYNLWTLFYLPFGLGAEGSTILLTTRNEGVASMMATVPAYVLHELSHDDCLSVFSLHALGTKGFNSHMHLQELGKEIVKKCQGLPLAAKALGGLLRGKIDCKSWEIVFSSKIWEEESGNILPALKLSYHHLPSHLKRCFVYCAIFPKDFVFEKNELILLWMAEGFLQQWNEGDEYFLNLVSRSFFQKLGGQKLLYVMHDLINDLARSISGEICFNLDEEMKVKKSTSKVRHLAFNRCEFGTAQRFEAFHNMNSLRTFLALPIHERKRFEYLSSKALDDLVPKFECLRVLCLPWYCMIELPNSIGTLKHLRYLNVSHSKIERLPESLGRLINLQTLLLKECTNLLELPTKLGDLINLQCLDISGTTRLKEMPLNIGHLRNLHTLTKFIVGGGKGQGIIELTEVPNLRGKLHITGLHNVENVHEVERIKIKARKGLEKLVLEWTSNFDDSRNGIKELEILNLLQPQQNITSLSIKSYGGTIFPTWIGCALFRRMTSLKLCNCRKIVVLPLLGWLPSLRDLRIEGISEVKEVGLEFYGEGLLCLNAFPSLEILNITNMAKWEHWSWPLDSLNELRELKIANCPKLVGSLPNHLPSLQQLQVCDCPLLEALPHKAPCLRELDVRGCNKVIFRDMPPNLVSLTRLEVRNISGLVCLNEVFFKQPFMVLEYVSIHACNELMYLWGDEIDLGKLVSLKRLEIWNCKEIVSLVEGEEGNFPCNLQSLGVYGCSKLEKLPVICLPHSLKSLDITGCHSLPCLPKGILVGVSDGNDNNEEVEMKTSFIHIEQLEIRWNESLALTPSHVGNKLLFPNSLRSLSLGQDTMTPILFESMQMQNWLSHLNHLEIWYNKQLESFPTFLGDIGLSFPTLTSFTLDRCTKLRCLPNHMHKLTSLRELVINYCHDLTSFPKGGFPPNLSSLQISCCNKLERLPLSDWRLHTFTSLQKLVISGDMELVSSFPDDDDNNGLQLLPSTLNSLSITGFKNLKSISNSLRSLSSLERLYIRGCLQLHSLPRDGFPPSLGSLVIMECPLLKEKCLKGKGDYWPLIAAIPCIIDPSNPYMGLWS